MAITSFNFILFIIASLFLFCICPKKFRWIMLLIVSIVFYAICGIEAIPFIIYTSLTVWYGATKIGKVWADQKEYLATEGLTSEDKKARREQDKKKAKRMLTFILLVNLAILFNGKIFNYLSIRLAKPFLADSLIVPLGVSYYTFSSLGYLLDVYWKRYEHEKNYFRFLLYAIYYPHIVQGPISRYNKLGQELKKELTVSWDRICKGAQLIMWGYFKKLVIADRLSVFTSQAFADIDNNGTVYLVAIIFDVFQIYTDFSGYMDIVRGVSEMFGVELERNFNHPFFSKTVPEFWRRWHMSLGSWFKDYVYYPITICKPVKNLKKWSDKHLPAFLGRLILTMIPVMITWISTGLWHGTGAGYVAWGLYYGTLITISVSCEELFVKFNQFFHIKTEAFSFKCFQMVRMFFIFAGGRMLTKGLSITQAFVMAKQIFVNQDMATWFNDSLYNYGLDKVNMGYAVTSIIFLWIVSAIQTKCVIRDKLAEQNWPVRWIILLAGFFAIVVFGIYGAGYSTAGFAYQQF